MAPQAAPLEVVVHARISEAVDALAAVLDPKHHCGHYYAKAQNLAPFDVTGHLAASLPCGMSGGLPAGLMLVGAKWGEAAIYRAAAIAFEQAGGWRSR